MATATQTKHSKLDHVHINPGLTIIHPDPEQPRKSSNEKISVDIIAVPGLGANPEWTWKSKNRVDWIRDANMLSTTIPNARIMICEYESQWFGKGALNQRLTLVGEQLIRALFHIRSKGPKPPIVFVCHSLGGLVVEQALLFAKLRQSDFPDIFTFVVGSVFLGTPFRGTKSQSKASVFASLAKLFGLGENSNLLKLLKEDSEGLRDLLHDFSLLATEAKMRMFCFFEQHESDLVKLAPKELIVKESSACIDSFDRAALPSDHFGLNKFTGPKDGGYSMVSGEINTIVQLAPGIIKSRENAMRQNLIDNDLYLAILDALRATDPEQDMKDSVAGRPTSQASWVLQNDIYQQWRTMQAWQILWIHGDPGKGQAIVASSLIQELEQHAREDNVFLAYFFCDEKEKNRRKTLDILKLLVRQIIRKRPDLTEHLLLDKGRGKKNDAKSRNWDFTSISAVWNGLQSMLRDPSVGTAYFIVNGIDETDAESRKEFLTLLRSSLEPQLAEEMSGIESVIKWIFLSRSRRPELQESLQKALVIDMDDDENADLVNAGVKAWISDQVDTLAKQMNFNASLVYFIKKHIYSKAEGNYIYVNLMIQELKNLDPAQASIAKIRKFLEEFPYGLRDMFEHIRRRVLTPGSEGIEYTKEIFRSLLIAQESPDIFELAIIADLPVDERGDESALRRYISRCGAFVTVSNDGDQTVEWIDTAAKEYLEENARKELSLDLTDVQHGIIALRCLDYVRTKAAMQIEQKGNEETTVDQNDMNQEAPNQSDDRSGNQDEPTVGDDEGHSAAAGQVQDGESVDQDGQKQLDQSKATNDGTYLQATADGDSISPSEVAENSEEETEDLLYYPSEYWLDHAKLAPLDLVKEFNLDDEFWSEKSESRAFWWEDHAEFEYPDLRDVTSLHIAALSGYLPLVNHLLENGHESEIQKMDSWGRSPFFWACQDGNIDMVRRLLEAGADISASGALCVAASENHIGIVQHLLERQAKIDVQDQEFGTPLYAAAQNGCTDVVRKLLHSGADVNLIGGIHHRALNIAAYFGHTEIVQLLLEKDITIDPEDNYFLGSALGAAARHGHAEIIRLLLRRGWNVNRKFKTNDSALVVAATYGHADAVQALLEQKTDVTSQEKALEVASKKGKMEAVEKLLEEGSRLRHQEAFRLAAYYGRNGILELLRKLGTTQEMLDIALYHASDQERQTTVDLLLKFGADPDAEGEEYGSALIAAAYDGTEEIVKLLLEHKANVNSQHDTYGNALQTAARFGNLVIVQILLDHGAYVNTQAVGQYGSALQAACFSGNKAVVELLLQRGANVYEQGGEYSYPIIAAADEGRGEIVEILVDHGADVNVNHVTDDNTPLLVLAGFTLNKDYMELLLNHGANIEGMDDQSTTVLIAAAASCDPEGVTMLLDRGANLHALDHEYGTALHAAASEGDEECCQILLKRGAEVNWQCGPWNTALQAAAEAADLETVELLLNAGADVSLSGGDLGSALQAAAFSGSLDCLQALMKARANVNQEGGKYGAALQAAAYAGKYECLLALCEAGANINYCGGKCGGALQAAASQGHVDCLQTLLQAGADVNQEGGKYGTVLQAAVFANSHEIVTKLLEHHVNVYNEGGLYGNALNAAACKGWTDMISLLLEQSLPDEMLDGGLLQAVYHRQSDAVEMLLKNGASVHAIDPVLGSALDALQKEISDDTNSDDMGDWDDEDTDEDTDEDADSEVEDENEGQGGDEEADASSDEEGLDVDFAGLELEALSPEEKIRKILEEAMAKVGRNPSIKRFRSVKNRHLQEQINVQSSKGANSIEVTDVNDGLASFQAKDAIAELPIYISYSNYDSFHESSYLQLAGPGNSNYQNVPQTMDTRLGNSNSANTSPPVPAPANGDTWRQASQSQNAHSYQATGYQPSQAAGVADSDYAAYNSLPGAQPPPLPARPNQMPQTSNPLAYNAPQHPPPLMAASQPKRNYQAYGGSQVSQSYDAPQYPNASMSAYGSPEAYGSQHTAPQSYAPPQHPYQHTSTSQAGTPKRESYQAYSSSTSTQSPDPNAPPRPSATPTNSPYASYNNAQPSYAPQGYHGPIPAAQFSPPPPNNSAYTNIPPNLYAGHGASAGSSGTQATQGRPSSGAGEDADLKVRAQGWMRKAKNFQTFL